MEILSSRTLIRPHHLKRSREFYRDVLGLPIHREFGPPESLGTVFFCGNGLIEVSGQAEPQDPAQHPNDSASSASSPNNPELTFWMQVRDVATEYERIKNAGATVLRAPQEEFWGLIEAWVADPDGIKIVLVQIPEDHPLRRDQRGL